MATAHAHAWGDGQSLAEWLGLTCLALVFLIGPAIPQLLLGFERHAEFEVLSEGPVLFHDHASYSLQIQNNARTPRHAVEVWVPVPPGGDAAVEPGPYDSSPATMVAIGNRDGHRVFGIGDVDAGALRTLSVRVSWMPVEDADGRRANPPWVMAKVVSAEGRAHDAAWRVRAYRSESGERWYRNAFALMSAAVVVLAAMLLRPQAQPAPRLPPAPKEAWRRPAGVAFPRR